MPHTLQNEFLKLNIDEPLEGYNFSRFDWTGKITEVHYKGVPVSTIENTLSENHNTIGQGFYNEFSTTTPIGFKETRFGDWFLKIGIGLLKKEKHSYHFLENYIVKPAQFTFDIKNDKAIIICTSELTNGYAYVLKKEIVLNDNSFSIHYHLENAGQKDIITNEYNHNFLAINNDLIGTNYTLKFPFEINPRRFRKTVNLENKVDINTNSIGFNDTPNEDFFFSNLSGKSNIENKWELLHSKNKFGITSKGDFNVNKVNLWGWKHVICPEMFFKIYLNAGESRQWTRTYNFFDLK
ncbi:MAG: hypothetical protein Wins2KO_13840 [Winogradskyella sp.]